MKNRTAVALGIASALLVALPAVAQQSLFRDVPGDAYFSEAVAELSRIGVIRGYDDGRFGPGDLVTRAQVAVMFDRYDRMVVETLRRQIEQMRRELGLGSCGDGDVQVGEVCDDGNIENGDGCSRYCQSEQGAPGCFGHRVGESFPSPDGCNTCTCTESGAACTLRACTPEPRAERCFSSADCETGEMCTTEAGACESACEPGAEVCIQVCAGRCVPREEVSCKDEHATYDRAVADSRACQTNDDCVIVEQSCPFVTCGVAVNRDGEASVRDAAGDLVACQEDSGAPLACADCLQVSAVCERGRCTER